MLISAFASTPYKMCRRDVAVRSKIVYEGYRRQYLYSVELAKKVEFLLTFYILNGLQEKQSDRLSLSRQTGRFKQL